MNDWVTIASFYYAHQAELLKGRIESEGIECNVKDELTATANPLYSNAIGGVKVQVLESDVQKVIPILKEAGYTMDDDGSYKTSIEGLIKYTDRIPLINKYPLEKRYTIIILATVVIMALVIWVICFLAS